MKTLPIITTDDTYGYAEVLPEDIPILKKLLQYPPSKRKSEYEYSDHYHHEGDPWP